MAAAAAAKISVVERDPTEQGDRRLLNFGHTLGHAIESAGGYGGLRHGEAVGYGILFALRLSLARGLDGGTAERLRNLLVRFGLPPLPVGSLPASSSPTWRATRRPGRRGWSGCWPARSGEGFMSGVPGEEVEAELQGFLRAPWSLPGERVVSSDGGGAA